MASILDLARCSKAVYDDLPSVDGWRTERVFSFHALGFFACLFRRDGEAVFAIRGTDDLLDVFNDLQLAAGTLPIQHAPARAALSKAYQESAVPSKNFILTGHSLGGGIAALKAARKTPAVPVVTFNAPGMYRSVTQAGLGPWVYLYRRNGVREYRGRSRKAIHIRHEYDVVSRLTGPRINGREKTLTNKECQGRDLWGRVNPFYGATQRANKALCAHRMQVLLNRLKVDDRFSKEIDWSEI